MKSYLLDYLAPQPGFVTFQVSILPNRYRRHANDVLACPGLLFALVVILVYLVARNRQPSPGEFSVMF